MRRRQARHEFVKDIIFILIGIVGAIVLTRLGVIDWLVTALGGHVVASFVAGIFFTSAFTIAPASVAFAHIAGSIPISSIVVWGGLGAMCGDLILFFFIRDRFARDLVNTMKPSVVKHFFASLHLGFLKWLSPILGALIIASPLPDEFGLALMGISKMRVALLMPISFVMNMIGIYGILWFVQAV